jgi:Protein of unknown function (DUF3048) N-terminal domain/Protein of unknown function (DUF3048) C-terminal domain
VASVALPGCWGQSISASIAVPKSGFVRINEPVVVDFSEKIDAKTMKLAVDPKTNFKLDVKDKKVMVTPTAGWRPGQIYALSVNSVSSSDHSLKLSGWKGKFTTQQRVGIAGYLIDGKAVAMAAGPAAINPFAKVTITFTTAMKITTATPTRNGSPILDAQYRWADDGKSVDIPSPGYIPYQPLKLGITSLARTAKGETATDLEELSATVTGVEPSNSSSQIPAGFQTLPAMLVVVDNAGQARPQAGLQAADIAWEYISEYNISRFTLTYFNNLPAQIGPVRSCRMINPFLGDAFHGVTMCSGASDGTLRYLWGTFGSAGIPVIINDYDTGNHFMRVNFMPAPHNLFTDGGRVGRARQEAASMGGGKYTVDAPHPDNAAGAPADPPSIPLQGVSYSWDGGCGCYRPFDHGSPRVDTAAGGAQLAVKNVVVMHVPFGQAGWTEDVNGGAGSIRYAMNGTGPAELWSNGRLVHATWHQGADGQDYSQNTTQPVYFTDEAGNVLRLNTGLTWIHVVGNGQTS